MYCERAASTSTLGALRSGLRESSFIRGPALENSANWSEASTAPTVVPGIARGDDEERIRLGAQMVDRLAQRIVLGVPRRCAQTHVDHLDVPGPCRPLHARDDPRYRPRSAGAGVRVAVLDSGADTSHPDLAKRIMASRSFVPGENVTDRNGHDTHTAHLGRDGRCLGGKKTGHHPRRLPAGAHAASGPPICAVVSARVASAMVLSQTLSKPAANAAQPRRLCYHRCGLPFAGRPARRCQRGRTRRRRPSTAARERLPPRTGGSAGSSFLGSAIRDGGGSLWKHPT